VKAGIAAQAQRLSNCLPGAQSGIVLSRDLILERVWGWDYGGGSRTVDVHVRGCGKDRT
jgi:DNA-binding response OmpR family regulator